jgi:hypothetical protein
MQVGRPMVNVSLSGLELHVACRPRQLSKRQNWRVAMPTQESEGNDKGFEKKPMGCQWMGSKWLRWPMEPRVERRLDEANFVHGQVQNSWAAVD